MRKRIKGEGTIYQMPNKKYRGQYDCGTVNGKRMRKSFTANTKSEVLAMMKKYEAELALLSSADAGSSSFQSYAEHWLETFKEPTLKPQSYKRLYSTLVNHVFPAIGQIPISEISSSDLQKFINSKAKDPSVNSHSSIVKMRDAINAILQYAEDNRDIVKNPCRTVVMPSADNLKSKKAVPFFTDAEQLRIIIESIRTYSTGRLVYPYGWAIILILSTGLRMGEALAAPWENFDIKNRILHIDRSLARIKTGSGKSMLVVQRSPKTASSIRDVYINADALRALAYFYKISKDKDAIIVNTRGGFVSPNDLERCFYKILENCGISKTGIHTLRHTFATNLFEKGVDVKTVSALLGHSSINITYNTYIHVIEKNKLSAVSSIETPLFSGILDLPPEWQRDIQAGELTSNNLSLLGMAPVHSEQFWNENGDSRKEIDLADYFEK